MINTKDLFWWDKIKYAIKNTNRVIVRLGTQEWKLDTPSNKERVINDLTELFKSLPDDEKNNRVEELINQLDVDIKKGIMHHPILNWEEVEEMRDKGISFGSHALTHRILTKIPLEEARKEIAESKSILEQRVGKSVKYFSYPSGEAADFDEEIKEVIKDEGYVCALTTIKGYNYLDSDLFELKRIPVGENNNLSSFATIVSGLWGKLHGKY